MVEVKKILFPVDFTENSKKIFPYVKSFAKTFGARITLINIVKHMEDFAGFELMGAERWALFEKDSKEKALGTLKNIAADDFSEFKDVDYAVIVGDIVDEIIDYAEQKKIDLIIISTHGRKGLEKVMLGSVAEGVVKRASCPVLTINPYKCVFGVCALDR
ncbi:MAG: universal stress protein [Desulfobacteraceae bacterium]|nr:universal stress protein [Desulfobacteraceae bacterium]